MDGGEIEDQALWSEDQTEVFVPDPVVDVSSFFSLFGNFNEKPEGKLTLVRSLSLHSRVG